MFTGIVEELGTVEWLDGTRLRLRAGSVLDDAEMGSSIAVNGCCLTVVAFETGDGSASSGWWEADMSGETLARTCLGDLLPGQVVNLERPVRLDDRLGGHLVQGHVDAVGTILATPPDLQVSAPPEVMRYLVEKGSVTVDGVSLTVVDVLPDSFTVAVIPHTASVTTLGHKPPDSRVNLEIDVIAKYTERLLEPHLHAARQQESPGQQESSRQQESLGSANVAPTPEGE
jgi:riboflavin synthase